MPVSPCVAFRPIFMSSSRSAAFAHRSTKEVFNETQRQVRWHYQWIILNEFLPLTIGQGRVDDIAGS